MMVMTIERFDWPESIEQGHQHSPYLIHPFVPLLSLFAVDPRINTFWRGDGNEKGVVLEWSIDIKLVMQVSS